MTTVKKGATDQTFYFKMIDSSTGVPEAGLTIANIDATYTRNRAAAVKNDLTALAAVDTAHTDNKGIEVDATNAPGLYRIDFPDAAFATGVDKVILSVTCSGCDPAMKEIELVDNEAVDIYTRIGAPAGASVSADIAAAKVDTAAIKTKTDFLPSATAGAAGGVFIAGSNAATTVNFTGNLSGSVGSVTGAVGSVTGNVGGNVAGSVASVTAGVTLTSGERNSVADALLDRNVAGGSSAGRLVKEALYVLRNKTAIAAGTMTVYGTDDTTAAFTAAVTTAAGDPISSIDPG